MESILSLGPLLIPIFGIIGGCAVAITIIVVRHLERVETQLNVGRHATTVICIQYGLIDCRLAPNIGLERSCQLLAFSSQ